MANRTVEAILRLSSKLGNMAAFRQLSGHLDKVDRKAKAFNRTQSGVIASSSRALAASTRMLMGAGVAYGVKNTLTSYAAVERRLNRIAINADKGRDSVDSMLRVVNQTSHDYAMTQDDVTSGLEELVAAGRSAEDALSFLPSVTATAQASGAAIADIATTADAVGNSFDITADKMQHAFDILVEAGKQGKFELRDMAQYLPSMAPAFAALGYKGEKGLAKLAALLQTIRQRTGSASEAATAAQNIFQKMESEQTAKKFGEFGVNLRKEMARARREGRDLVDVFIDLTNRATKGDLSKIPLLFTDAQFQVGMRALMQGRADMEGFQKALADVDGTTLRDLSQVLSDNQTKLDRMASSWEKFKTSVGGLASTPAGGALDYFSDGADYAMAVNEGLEKNGVKGFLARTWFGLTTGQDEKDAMAAAGGYMTEEQRAMAAAAGQGDAPTHGVYPELPKDKHGMPIAGPIPDSRIDPDSVGPRLPRDHMGMPVAGPVPAFSARPVASQQAGPTHREAENASMEALRRHAGEIADEIEIALGRGTDTLGPALVDAGGAAGKTLADSAAGALAVQADGIGARIGAAFGAAIRPYLASAWADLSRPVGSLGSRGINADVGRSGGDVQASGGQ